MTIPRIPDPGPDDDARVQAAVVAFAERELAAVALEPITATEVTRGRGRGWFALVGVAAAAAVAVTLVGSQLLRTPIPAAPVSTASAPTPGAQPTFAQCLAGLTADDVVPGSANLSVGDLRIVGYVVTRYESGRMTARTMATKPVPVIATDDRTGEAAELQHRASSVVWQTVGSDGFLTDTELERWVNPEAVVPVKPGTMIQAAVFQMAQVTVTLQVRCGEAARDITVTGTNNPVIPGRTTSSLTGIDCAGPDAELPAGYSAEFITFARTCHTLV